MNHVAEARVPGQPFDFRDRIIRSEWTDNDTSDQRLKIDLASAVVGYLVWRRSKRVRMGTVARIEVAI